MKRRLRKKRRLGEFREDCFELSFEFCAPITRDRADSEIDDFIDMIESRSLQFGGGGKYVWSGIVQGAYRRSATESDRTAVASWLRRNPRIVAVKVGPLRDAWHGWA